MRGEKKTPQPTAMFVAPFTQPLHLGSVDRVASPLRVRGAASGKTHVPHSRYPGNLPMAAIWETNESHPSQNAVRSGASGASFS